MSKQSVQKHARVYIKENRRRYFYAHGQTLKIGKIANFESLKVHEDQIFEL
jgi:hypothetical protein